MTPEQLRQRLAYVTPGFDRAALLRTDDDRIAGFLNSGNARVLPIWKQRHLIVPGADGALAAGTVPDATGSAEPVFLGLADAVPWFAVGLPDSEAPPDLGKGEFRVLNEVVSLLPATEAALLAYARGMVIWQFNHRFCGRCGHATRSSDAGHSRTCTNPECGHRTFPRIDPAVITAIIHPDGAHILLGRQKQWVPGMYSTIAGFVEPGETLEQAVARETLEETGVQVTDVLYMGSQPWPFPSSVMLGFRARAVSTDIRRDDEELEDCRWFSRAEVRAFGELRSEPAGYRLPNPFSISRFLIDSWLYET